MANTRTPTLRDRVLEAAREILAQEGHEALSMRRIAQMVACKAPSIYHHFENKDQIVDALVMEGFEMLNGYLAEAVEGESRPIKRYEDRNRAFISFGLKYPSYYHIMFAKEPGKAKKDKKIAKLSEEFRKHSVADMTHALEMGQVSSGETPELLVSGSAAMLHGLIRQLLRGRDRKKVDKTRLVEWVIHQTVHM
ncbi:TetR/AcrR family transcriptional regulator [Pontibacter sp. G13]|uniref:TetR/AcrR family transcriptional regulator n=1 Tax=Pontibacter sp. G13 TaxID=3074898 RepID=UPI00288BA2D6|nr:TetR/AcrR family transcriptional regulator [Pontibacter sp. G13]WNJ19979.1 TetR/AcrR family transcriptional regulator [Pontibacter sp. G13]